MAKREINLPQILLEDEIFLRLPVKSLVRFKSLSKQWYSVISSAQFIRSHIKYHCRDNLSPKTLLIDTNGSIYFSDLTSDDNQISLHRYEGTINTTFHPNLVQIVGSCRGLICSYHGMEYFFVWNPSTKTSRKIWGYSPIYKRINDTMRSVRMTITRGFGYVSSIDDFKIVQIHVTPSSDTSDSLKTSIFTLKGGDWKDLANDYHGLNPWRRKCSVRPGTALVNETLYWLVDIGENSTFVLAFDLAKEVLLDHIQLPPILSTKFEAFLTVIDQCLSICVKNGSLLELWILRCFEWQKHFKVNLGMNVVGGKVSEWNLFGWYENESAKIIVRLCDGKGYFVVDIGRNRSKPVSLPCQFYLAFGISYVESLICPSFADDGLFYEM